MWLDELAKKSLKPFLDSLKNIDQELIIKEGDKIHYLLSNLQIWF